MKKNVCAAFLLLLFCAAIFAMNVSNAQNKEDDATESSAFEKVKFQRIKYNDEYIKKYPFLRDEIGSLDISPEIHAALADATIDIASIDSKEGKRPVLFVLISGSLFCGSAGCQLHVYSYDASLDKYRPIKPHINTLQPIFKAECPNNLHLFFGNTFGSEWIYDEKNEELKIIRQKVNFSKNASCDYK